MINPVLYLNAVNNDGLTWNKKNYLLAAAKRLGFDFVKDIKDLDDGKEPDFVLNIEPYFRFVKGRMWTGIWEIDMVLDRREMSKSDWLTSDDVFVANTAIPNHMNPFLHKTRLLFQASDPEIHRRYKEIVQTHDFVFCGSGGSGIYKERSRLIMLLRKYFSFADFTKGQDPIEYIKCLNTAKVQFIRSGKTTVANSWTAQRFFECLAIGPVLADWTPDLEKTGLIEGEDYLSYKNDSELLEKMHKLLEDEKYANNIAENGRRKSLLYHTYDHRLISILNIIRSYGYDIQRTFRATF